MHFEDVNSEQELNQKITDYGALGYEIEDRTPQYVRIVKNKFNWGTFIILSLVSFLFLGIAYLIYKAIKQSDEIVIRVKENTSNNTSSEAYKYCEKCETFSNEGSEFCENCGKPLSETLYVNIVNCPFCREKIPANIDRCDYCGEWLGGENEWEAGPPTENIYKKL